MNNSFYWLDIELRQTQSPAEQYQQLIHHASNARGQNPNAFDKVTEWLLCDEEWTEEKLAGNERILMQDIIGRFLEQTKRLQAWLQELAPHGVVNEAVFKAIDVFMVELSGKPHDQKRLGDAVSKMFCDFSSMKDPSLRKQIAGDKTGPCGTDSVETFGYINHLKNCDAGVQWALFMPQMVAEQQKGFSIQSFEYITMPGLRFIGRDCDDSTATAEGRMGLFAALDRLEDCKSGHDYDVVLIHHYGKGVDVDDGHAFWGRFFRADTPVPEGFVSFDFIPHFDDTPGLPFGSQFAFAKFEGDNDALHEEQGYDANAMYDVTRNTMLGQGVTIPYSEKYWTAEVFLDGHTKPSSAFMFSADLDCITGHGK